MKTLSSIVFSSTSALAYLGFQPNWYLQMFPVKSFANHIPVFFVVDENDCVNSSFDVASINNSGARIFGWRKEKFNIVGSSRSVV